MRLCENRPRYSREGLNAMALDDSALLELIEMLRTADGGELMRRLLGGIAASAWSTPRRPRSSAPGRTSGPRPASTQRNGTRDKLVTTTAGDLTVKIPKVRTGSFFPALLCAAAAHRRRAARGGDAGLRRGRVAPAGSMTWSSRWAAPGSPRARSRGSARSSTLRSRPGGPAPWTTSRSPTCSSTRPTARSASTAASCPRPS